VFVVIITTRFMHGPWAVLVALPLLVLMFRAIPAHYRAVDRQLSLERVQPLCETRHPTALVLVSGIHRDVIPALEFAPMIDHTTALHVNMEDEATAQLQAQWRKWGCGVPLEILPSPYRGLIQPVLHYIDELDARDPNDILTVIVPEFIPTKWWHHLLYHQTALLLKAALLFRKNTIVVSVPYHLEE
jgi:hypothetical protein